MAADPVGPDALTMHLATPAYPPRFDLVDAVGGPLGTITTPAVPSVRNLVQLLRPLRSGRSVTFTLADSAGTARATIERTAAGAGGPGAIVTAADGSPVASCEGHGFAIRTYRVLSPDRGVLATIDGAMPAQQIRDSAGTVRGQIDYEPPRHGTRLQPGHDTWSFHFRFETGMPAAVRLGAIAAMVAFQTAPS